MKNSAKVLRSAFWSGRMTYRMWRGMVRRGPKAHMKVFVQSFLHLPLDWLHSELGDEKFITVWPQIRDEFSRDSPFEMTIQRAWDALWGAKAAGDAQYPVSSEVAALPRMRREVLKAVVQNPGISVYALAKELNRDYSRVFKDVSALIEMKEIQAREDMRANRKIKQLLPARSINTVLAGKKPS